MGAALAATTAITVGCSSDGEVGGSTSDHCVYKESGTNYASCKTDSDCLSGYCKSSCSPGPCCATRPKGTTGRGYDCKTDEDCIKIAPTLISRGGKVGCERSDIYDGCYFSCESGR